MRETRLSGSEGGGAVAGSPYPYRYGAPSELNSGAEFLNELLTQDSSKPHARSL